MWNLHINVTLQKVNEDCGRLQTITECNEQKDQMMLIRQSSANKARGWEGGVTELERVVAMYH